MRNVATLFWATALLSLIAVTTLTDARAPSGDTARDIRRALHSAQTHGAKRYANAIKKATVLLKHASETKKGPAKAVRDALVDTIEHTSRRFSAQAAPDDVAANIGVNMSCMSNPKIWDAISSAQGECASDVEMLLSGSWHDFCSGSCISSLRKNFEPHRECLASNGAASLYHLVYACDSAPQCLSGAYLDDLKAYHNVCEHGLQATFDTNDATGSAIVKAKAFCSAGCDSKLAELLQRHPECTFTYGDVVSAPRVTAVVNLLKHMCSRGTSDEDVCSVELKGLKQMQCDIPSVCENSDSWCDSQCRPVFNDARLATLCGRCTMGLENFMGDMLDEGGHPALIKLLCMRAGVAGDSYCSAALPALLETVEGGDLPTTGKALDAFCKGDGQKCAEEALTLAGQLIEEGAMESWKRCAAKHAPEDVSSKCDSLLTDAFKSAYDLKKSAMTLCSKDQSGNLCVPLVDQFLVNAECARQPTTCTAACRSQFASAIQNAGCCAAHVDTVASKSGTQPYKKLPIEYKTFDLTTQRTQVRTTAIQFGTYYEGDRSMARGNDFAKCFGNTSAYWRSFEAPCSTTEAARAFHSQQMRGTTTGGRRQLLQAPLLTVGATTHSSDAASSGPVLVAMLAIVGIMLTVMVV